MKTTSWVAFLALIALMSAGCQRSVMDSINRQLEWRTHAARGTDTQYLRHTVQQPGETLSHIAQWYTGKIQNGEVIARHNQSTQLNALRKGDVVWIPKSLVINDQPMTEDYVRGIDVNRTPPLVKSVPHTSPPVEAPKPATIRKEAAAKPSTPPQPIAKPSAVKQAPKPPRVAVQPAPATPPAPQPKPAAPVQSVPEQFTLLEPVESRSLSSPPSSEASAPKELQLFDPVQ